jgi:hypothetical protein
MITLPETGEKLRSQLRTEYCYLEHTAICKPTDPKPCFHVGSRVCKLAEVSHEKAKIWCVIATGKASRCFVFAPNSTESEDCDTCVVIAPLSDIESAEIENKEHWTTEYSQSLLTNAPAYRCDHSVPILVYGRPEDHILQEVDWTYNELYTGRIYKLGGSQQGWMTEISLESAAKRASQQTRSRNVAIKVEIRDTD